MIFCTSSGENSIQTEPTESVSINESDIKTFDAIHSKMIFSDLTYLSSNIKNDVEKDIVLKYELDPTSETTPEIIPEETEMTITEPTEAVCEDVESPITDETISYVSEDDVELLACVIYQEVGSDWICDECRRRVADVVLNRVDDGRFPNSIYGVLTQEGQYGSYHWTGVVWPDRAYNSGEAGAVERARRIAREVLEGQHSDLYGNGYVWQAGFVQGYDGFWCCGHYFGK